MDERLSLAECYALGLDPTLDTNNSRIVSIELVDGEPKVEWEPKVNRWTGAEIQAVLKGAATLDGPWEDVPEGGSPGQLAPPLTARPTGQNRSEWEPVRVRVRTRTSS